MEQTDINTILQALIAENGATPSADTTGDASCSVYDFANPEHLPSEFKHQLESIHVAIARALSGLLSEYSGATIQVEPLAISQQTFHQYRESLPKTAEIATCTIHPLEGQALCTLDAPFVEYLLDCGLGGFGDAVATPRAFTPMERGLVDDLFQRIFRELGKAWEVLAPIRFNLQDSGGNSAQLRALQPDDRIVICPYAVCLPRFSAQCTYGIPARSLDFERLANRAQSWDAGARGLSPEQQHAQISEQLLTIPLPLHACLRNMSLPFREVAMLQVGDIIQTDCRVDEPLELYINSQPSFYIRPVTVKNTLAVEILSEVEEQHYD